jgi:hypothetical protein
VLALKAAINGYKLAEMEVRVAPGPSWASVLNRDETVNLFKEAMTLLVDGGIRVQEMAKVAGLDTRSIEVAATTVDEEGK